MGFFSKVFGKDKAPDGKPQERMMTGPEPPPGPNPEQTATIRKVLENSLRAAVGNRSLTPEQEDLLRQAVEGQMKLASGGDLTPSQKAEAESKVAEFFIKLGVASEMLSPEKREALRRQSIEAVAKLGGGQVPQRAPAPASQAARPKQAAPDFSNTVTVQYSNWKGERKTFTAARNSVLRRKDHLTLCVTPSGKRIALQRSKIANLVEVERNLPA